MQQHLDLLDLFSGKSRISRLAERMGYQSRAVDIEFGKFRGPGRNSSMDLNCSAGLVLLGSTKRDFDHSMCSF